ncbi:hypothetical protein V6N11_016978 [Hibiscus sabdariffa]|uniref:Uncharacterized protein n=1 Tax=Hibiscus sabdariffa TaxID=183260 RepID=A0ABR2TWQ5_9ROSI
MVMKKSISVLLVIELEGTTPCLSPFDWKGISRWWGPNFHGRFHAINVAAIAGHKNTKMQDVFLGIQSFCKKKLNTTQQKEGHLRENNVLDEFAPLQ